MKSVRGSGPGGGDTKRQKASKGVVIAVGVILGENSKSTDWDHGGIGFSRKLQMFSIVFHGRGQYQMLLRWSGRVLHHHEFRLAEVKQVHK